MNSSIKILAMGCLLLTSGCGGGTNPPETVNDKVMTTGQFSPEEAYIRRQITAFKDLADALNTVQTESDAHRVKKSAAAAFIDVFGLDGEKVENIDEDSLAETLAKGGLLPEYIAAQRKLGEAMTRLARDEPESYEIVAGEINELYKVIR